MNTNFIVTMEAARTHYSAREAAKQSISVRELINLLEQFDEDAPVVFSNDSGYTYGYVGYGTLDEIEVEEENED